MLGFVKKSSIRLRAFRAAYQGDRAVFDVHVGGESHYREAFSLRELFPDEHYRLLSLEQEVCAQKLKRAAGSSNKTQSSIWHVLGMMPSKKRADVLKAFKRMALVYHPDHGGTSETFQALTAAKEKALSKCTE